MSSVTSNSSVASQAAKLPRGSLCMRIKPPRGLFNLRMGEFWAYRELLYFFVKLAKLPSQGLPYSVFCFAAVVPWSYFSNALTSATNVVVENQRVITKV